MKKTKEYKKVNIQGQIVVCCDQCEYCFLTLRGLKIHIKAKHE